MWQAEDEVFFKRDLKLPSNKEEMKKFLDRLQSERSELLRSEPYIFSQPYTLVKKPPQVDILHRWTYTTRHDQITDIGYRAALNPLLFEAFTEAGVRPEVQLILTLCTGENKWGQVWKGRIRYNDEEADVAIKLYIQSLFPLPDDLQQVQREFWASSPLQARNEAWAYAHMHSLQVQFIGYIKYLPSRYTKLSQGRDVPRSLGFFQCALRTGEISFAHVMEYVAGSTADKISLKNCSEGMQVDIAESMASGICNIGACGISHGDFHGGNMLVRDDFLPPVCFIDFGMAEVLEKALDPYHMVMIVDVLRQAGVEMDLVKKWIEKRREDNPEPTWIKLVRELEDNPNPFDWLVMIESRYRKKKNRKQ